MAIFKQPELLCEKSENLNCFLSTLKQINLNTPLDRDLREEIKSYFAHRWKKNRNEAMMSGSHSLLIHLPKNKQRQFYFDFVFKDLLDTYQKCLKFKKLLGIRFLKNVLKQLKGPIST